MDATEGVGHQFHLGRDYFVGSGGQDAKLLSLQTCTLYKLHMSAGEFVSFKVAAFLR